MALVRTLKWHIFSSSITRTFDRLLSSMEMKNIFDAVKAGDLQKIQGYQIDKEIGRVRDKRGWNPLLHAVKLGHLPIVQHLITSGVNPSLKTYSGHSALDIAIFWKQKEISGYLEQKTDSTVNHKSPVFFSQNPLVRHAGKRDDEQWLFSTVANPKTKFILMYKAQPVVIETTEKSGRSKMKLLQCSILEIHNFISDNRQNLIFLGIFPDAESDISQRKVEDGSAKIVSEDLDGGTAWFAIDTSDGDFKDIQSFNKNVSVLSVYPGVLQLSAIDASIVAQARSLTDWHFRYKFCPTCGTETLLSDSGYKRICQNATCLSHSGLFNTNYPRVDPTVISTVLSPDKDHCLLGRKKSFPPGMFTCLAGFVEPGESIEGACVREVQEEVGVKVSQVDYVASQPWPMPSVLMLGCQAHAESQGEIKLDEEELEEARWFPRHEVVEMITQAHKDRLFVPPQQAIAHQLIKHWLLQSS